MVLNIYMTKNTNTTATAALFNCIAGMADIRRAKGMTEDEIAASIKASLIAMMSEAA